MVGLLTIDTQTYYDSNWIYNLDRKNQMNGKNRGPFISFLKVIIVNLLSVCENEFPKISYWLILEINF